MWAAVWAAVGAVVAAIVAGGWAWWDLKQTIKAQASNLEEQFAFQGKRDIRTIYAHALAALKKFETERTNGNKSLAREAVSAVALVEPGDSRVYEDAQSMLHALYDNPGVPGRSRCP
jgi:hypothetical protein